MPCSKTLFHLIKLTRNECLESCGNGEALPVGPFRPPNNPTSRVSKTGIFECEFVWSVPLIVQSAHLHPRKSRFMLDLELGNVHSLYVALPSVIRFALLCSPVSTLCVKTTQACEQCLPLSVVTSGNGEAIYLEHSSKVRQLMSWISEKMQALSSLQLRCNGDQKGCPRYVKEGLDCCYVHVTNERKNTGRTPPGLRTKSHAP